MSAPEFDSEFGAKLDELLHWRRDVRHFRRDAVQPELIRDLLERAMRAPSVGYSQPWRWVIVESESKRNEVLREFEQCNAGALTGFSGEVASLYATLKLSGLKEAPVQIAVFIDDEAGTGKGLGQRTMPETRTWSVVMAIHTLWLTARAAGLGLGWVSILNPDSMRDILAMPNSCRFVAYLCVGVAEQDRDTPLLERVGWEKKLKGDDLVFYR